MRPDFGDVKHFAAVLFGVTGLHDLNVQLPDGEISTGNGVPEILCVKVGIDAGHALCFLVGQVADALGRAEMELAIFEVALVVDELECMDAEAVHPPDRVGYSASAKEMHQGMGALWLIDVKVPKLHATSA